MLLCPPSEIRLKARCELYVFAALHLCELNETAVVLACQRTRTRTGNGAPSPEIHGRAIHVTDSLGPGGSRAELLAVGARDKKSVKGRE
jgi:hypothetical protein